MKLLVHAFESRLVDVRVYLCCRDAGVSEHFLDLSQIGTTREQVGRKTVAKCVRADRIFDASSSCVLLDDFPNGFTTETTASPRKEEPFRRPFGSFRQTSPFLLHINTYRGDGWFAQRHNSLFVAFSVAQAVTVFQVDVPYTQPGKLRGTAPGSVQQF